MEKSRAAITPERPADPAPRLRPLPARDARSKRPPALAFLLRAETLRRGVRVLSLLALDFAGVAGAILTALVLKALLRGVPVHQALGPAKQYVAFAYLVTVLLFARSDLYAERARRPGLSAVIASLFQVTIVSLIFALASGEHFTSYYVFYGSLFFAAVYVSSLRGVQLWVTGKLLSRAGYRRRALVVGSGRHIEAVAHALSGSAHSPVELVGYVSLLPRPDNGLRSLGTLAELREILPVHRVEEVIIADPDFPPAEAVELVDTCHEQGVTVHVAPSTMELLVERAEFVPGQSVPLFTLRPPVFEGFDFLLKRTFDVVGACVLLLVLSPLLLAVAAAIKLGSRGPVLYRSERPGMGATLFACLKFRTMRPDAHLSQAELEERNEASGALFKIRHDPRVTAVGRFLRRFSIDELPQLLNVVRGEMSLVGPRPLPLRDFERLEEWHKKRYRVLPGITGLWQVSGRADLDFDDLVRLDFVYLERWSVFLDLVILLKTVPAVVGRRGAY